MKTTPKMQAIISRITSHQALDFSAPDAHLRLEQPGFMPLVIEKIRTHLLSVAHYYTQNGDAMASPDVVFFTGYRQWIPIEITQSLGGYRRVARLADDASTIAAVAPKAQAALARFCETWARNIEEQHWLEVSPPGKASASGKASPSDAAGAIQTTQSLS